MPTIPISTAFLIYAVAASALVLNAFKPVRRGRVLYVSSFFSSWLTVELVLHNLLIHVAATAAFSAAGGLGHPLGYVALGLCVVSWAAMIVLWRAGRRASRTMKDALSEYAATGPWPRVPVSKLWMPFWFPRSGVKRTRDVTFAEHGGVKLKLDVFEPREAGKKRPAVLQVHGGGWVIGDKREQGLPLLYHLASHGWVGFNANYRLSPKATWPDHLVDVKAALAWIREHADEYGVDPDFIVVTGGSAGGHLTAMLALTANLPRFQPGFEDADTSVQAAVPFYGVYDFTDRLGRMNKQFIKMLLEPLVMKLPYEENVDKYADASPLDHVGAHAPPFLVVHGTNDTLAPIAYARTFTDSLRDVSENPVILAEIEGAQHAFDVFTSPRTVRVIAGVERFLAGVYAQYCGRTQAPNDSVDEAGEETGDKAADDVAFAS